MDQENPKIKSRALVVEDDKSIVDLLSIHLKDLNFDVDAVNDGYTGLERALSGKYNLIILDIMLPGLDGMEVCKRIRQVDRSTAIMMLTSRSEELDKVLGLELGADEYMTKPFGIREFIARVKALFRRMEVDAETTNRDMDMKTMVFDDLKVDPEKRRVTLGSEEIILTAKEYELLELFARHPGKAYTRQQLLDIVWGYKFSGYDHTVNSHINRLRAKIEKDPAKPRYIQTVWSVGYRFIDLDEVGE